MHCNRCIEEENAGPQKKTARICLVMASVSPSGCKADAEAVLAHRPVCAPMRGFMGIWASGRGRFGKEAAKGRRLKGRSIDRAGIMRYNGNILGKFFLSRRFI